MRRAAQLLLPRLTLLCLVLAGSVACCAGPELIGGRYEEKLLLQRRQTFALVGPVLDDPAAWAYAQPTGAIAAIYSHYQVAALSSGIPATGQEFPGVRPLDEAPQPLRGALLAAREALIASGYRPAGEGAKPDFVLSLGLTSDEAGEVLKLDLNVGAEVEGRFDPQQASIVVGLTPEKGCEVDLNELVREVVGALPPHDPEGER